MDRLAPLLHLGDPTLTVPAALGIAAWLAAVRGWRDAACWLLLFGAALGLVGADKVAFLGWGGGAAALDYRAASGHAAGVTVIWPMLLALLLPQWRREAAVTGLGIGLLMAALLVALGQHSLSEALAGWAIGAIASLTALCRRPPWHGHLTARQRIAIGKPAPVVGFTGALACLAVFATATLLLHAAPTGYWLIKTALLLSGQRHYFPLHC